MSNAPRDLSFDPSFDRWHLDRRAVRAAFDAAAASYDRFAALQDEVRARLLERIELTRLEPRRILDLGCGTGGALAPLAARFPAAELIAVDFAPAMVRAASQRAPAALALCADGAALPLASGSIDLAFCNLMVQWEDDPRTTFAELRRVLAPRGMLLFSSFGPDTLGELRDAWGQADQARGADAVHVNRFLEMHDLGDAVVQSRLTEPVIDVEYLTTTYASLTALMRELKGLGAHNANAGRPRGLTGRGRFAAADAAYPRDADGRIAATWEVIYGIAWAPAYQQRAGEQGALAAAATDDGDAANVGRVSLEALRAELKRKTKG